MSIFRGRTVFRIARDRKLYLNIDAGITRGQVPDPDREVAATTSGVAPPPDASDARAENLVWTFGSAWSDSAWLGSMMGLTGGTVWNRPLLGDLFGDLFYVRAAHRRDRDFVLGGSEETRSKLIRGFVLSAVQAKFPRATHDGYLVVNEPGGSLGAPLLTKALPESRLVLLVRHPGEVIASALAASGESEPDATGNGLEEWREEGIAPFEDPEFVVANQAARYFDFVGNAKRAYEEHTGPKSLVRYEDLLADTPATMRRLYAELGMTLDERKLAGVAASHPREQAGREEGTTELHRGATPTNWREYLSPEQAEVVERVTAPLLNDLYPG